MKSFFRFIAFACLSLPAFAATIPAASPSAPDVQAAINLAAAGDTVLIPAGTANWTQQVSWTAPANVTLQGAGTSATGGGDQTIIQDNFASGSPILAITANPTGVLRITGITFRSGTGATKDAGTIQLGWGKVRIDHCHLIASSTANYKMIYFGSGVFGVLDSCILDFTGGNSFYVYNARDNGDLQGNYEWTLPTAFGGADYLYIEGNIINGNVPSGTYNSRIFDGFTGARVVVRFNTVSQAVLGETHATGHSGDDRGLRSQEIYGNAVTSSLAFAPNYCAIDISNGTALVWGNTWDQVYKNIYLLKLARKNNETYNQNPTPAGWGYAGTQFNGTGSMWDGGTANGTSTILGYPALDQVGRGAGQLLAGVFPSKLNTSTGTIFWPNQALEPVYIWNNPGGVVAGWGGGTINNETGARAVENRDFYLPASGIQTTPTSPFNGTVGVGWGTLANRPTTCTTGVAYFATDQGSWNTSTSNPYGVQQNGADGVLYKATATNTWTLYYEPYTFPHPMRNVTQVDAPIFSPVAGTYTTAQNVTITSATVGATIRYTTNGSTPTSSSGTIYSGAVSIPTTTTLKAIAYNGVLTDSTVTSGLFTINTAQVSQPSFSPVAGTYVTTQSVTITSLTGGATIRYTTNGTTPSSSVGTIYSTPVSISATATLKAIAYNGVLTDSAVTSGLFTINTPGDGAVLGTTTVTVELTLP